jgi:hypothetical protein
VVSVEPERVGDLEDLAGALRVPFARIGETGGPRMVVDGVADVTVDEAAAAYEDAIPKLLAGGGVHEA